MAGSTQEAVAAQILVAAGIDDAVRRRLEADPAALFAEAGIAVPEETREAFGAFVRDRLGTAMEDARRLSLAVEAEPAPEVGLMRAPGGDMARLAAFPSLACTACSVACWSIGAAIVAVGAAGLATLTAASPVVVALATFANVSAVAAQAFIVSLGATVAGGVAAVVAAICGWTGACP